MGNQDNWTTPKQIKIERKGEPKGVKRGIKPKGGRVKGQKARRDEILSAKNTALLYLGWARMHRENHKKHPTWYTEDHIMNYEKRFKEAITKLNNLIFFAAMDGILKTKDDADQYRVKERL